MTKIRFWCIITLSTERINKTMTERELQEILNKTYTVARACDNRRLVEIRATGSVSTPEYFVLRLTDIDYNPYGTSRTVYHYTSLKRAREVYDEVREGFIKDDALYAYDPNDLY